MLVILRGLPGSGKSTYAKEWLQQGPRRARINRDDDRMSLFNKEIDVDEIVISEIELIKLQTLLGLQYHVVIDNTNVRWGYVRQYANIAKQFGVGVEIKVFDVPVETAIARNNKRFEKGGRFVPHDAIRRMHSMLEANKHLTLD